MNWLNVKRSDMVSAASYGADYESSISVQVRSYVTEDLIGVDERTDGKNLNPARNVIVCSHLRLCIWVLTSVESRQNAQVW